jgi:hypothetical protein
MVCKVISLQCRGGTRWELFVNSSLGELMMSVWFIFCGTIDQDVRWAIVVAGINSCVFSCE